MNESYERIQLNQLKPNPHNPRQNFSGKKFDELVASIRIKGVIEPILVRPVKNKKTPYEIVAGERRFRASCEVADGALDKATIPALVRKLTDDEAYDIMTIENLQREDLTEIEEARSFKLYAERHGEQAVAELSQRCGIHPGYIRRRLQVLTLPEKVLAAWEKGDLRYGHCEQFLRLKDHKQVLKMFEDIWESEWHRGGYIKSVKPVAKLKSEIDRRAVKLSSAKFDTGECATCPRNTEVQKAIFDLAETEKASCLDPDCFKEKQRAWLTENWPKFGKSHKTKGFRFHFELSYNDHHKFSEWGAHPCTKCFSCDNFVSLLELDGKAETKHACVGTRQCFELVSRTAKAQEQQKKDNKKKAGSGAGAEVEVPRVEWHGRYFREVFFHKRIPEVLQEIPASDERIGRIILAAMLHERSNLKEAFGKRHTIKSERHCYFGNERLWPAIEKLNGEQLLEELKAAATTIMLEGQVDGGGYGSRGRRLVATHLSIDLQKEWTINEEYLEKKTISEILAFGKRLGIFEDPKAQTRLAKLGKKAFEKCSKKELVEIVLKSGADLAGKVPKEILEPDKER